MQKSNNKFNRALKNLRARLSDASDAADFYFVYGGSLYIAALIVLIIFRNSPFIFEVFLATFIVSFGFFTLSLIIFAAYMLIPLHPYENDAY